MTRLRRSIAERLKAAQDNAAMLTTFNEVDMSAVMAARKEYRDRFEKKHGVRLGFMSFFVKAAVQALKDIPAVNGEIAGDEIVYKYYYNIGVAVSSPQGLIVPCCAMPIRCRLPRSSKRSTRWAARRAKAS